MSLRLNKLGILCILLTITLILTACNSSQPRFIIGVSQCSSDIWRNKLIDELRTANYSRDDVQLCFVSANDDDQRQIAQIDSFSTERPTAPIILLSWEPTTMPSDMLSESTLPTGWAGTAECLRSWDCADRLPPLSDTRGLQMP